MRLKRASAYLTNPNRLAWPQIGPRLASDTGSFKNTADAPQTRLSAAVQAGKKTLVGSRFTHTAESCYSPIEGEAVADALYKVACVAGAKREGVEEEREKERERLL